MEFSLTFTGVSGSESTAQLLADHSRNGAQAGRDAAIRQAYLKQVSGDGTQWRVRLYRGWTASKTAQFITAIDLPRTAGDFGDGADEDTSVPETPPITSTRYGTWPAGWTDASSPRAGLGIYATVEQLANGGATADEVDITITTGRR